MLARVFVVCVAVLLAPAARSAVFFVTNADDSGQGSLRQAILNANAADPLPAGERHVIRFSIPGLPSSPRVISPESFLPVIGVPVFINGYSQPGSSPNTLEGGSNGSDARILIEISGELISSGSGPGPGLELEGGNSLVSGLAIHGFLDAIVFSGAGNTDNRVEGCFLGLRSDGTLGANARYGVAVFGSVGSSNEAGVGGPQPADRNVIAHNSVGIHLRNSSESTIENNLIGLHPDGSVVLGNLRSGIQVTGNSSSVLIQNNAIAGNDLEGGVIVINTVQGVTLRRNRIFENIGLGIDLGPSGPTGVTPNDPFDADTGPNGLQNFPDLIEAVNVFVDLLAGEVTRVRGLLHSTPNASFVLEFFHNSACHPSGHGEGERSLGAELELITDASGNADFEFQSAPPVPNGRFITATATGAGGSTSEFSKCVEVGVRNTIFSDRFELIR